MNGQRARQWLVGLTVVLMLVQGPTLGWAAHGHGGGGHFGGGGHMGGGHIGGFSGGHIGGGHMGGFSGGHHFSAPFHSFSMPSRGFSAPSHQFSRPSNVVHTPRSTPSLPNYQHHGGTGSLPSLQPGKGLTHNNWNLPTHNGNVKPNTPVTPFGQHHVNGTLSHGVLNSSNNPYMSPTGGVKGNPQGGTHGANLPNIAHHHLPGLGQNGHSIGGTHNTLKPTLGGANLVKGHPHIGGHSGYASNVSLTNGIKGGGHSLGNNLPQFQSHHGNHGNWGLGNGPRPGFGGGNGFGGNGFGGGNWNSAWRNNCVHHHHHNWYNGAWGGFWGFGFYAPYAWGAGYWGLGSFYSPWGYGYNYYNPYCVAMVQPAYASLPVNYYSQPVALPQQPVDDSADVNRGAAYQLVDAARSDFRNGQYTDALNKLDQAIPQLPNDTVVHELRGLALFSLGEYRPAAATLNAVLAVAPGMDWATLRGLYPSVEVYQAQLRKLEETTRANQADPALRFVLVYLYMVTNYPDAATAQLKKVVELEPQDVVAKRLLESLTQPAPPPSPEAASANPAQTDLVGRWQAKANGITFDLTLNEGLQFDWQVTPADGKAVKQSGRYTATSDRLILESAGEETLVVKVQSQGTDRFQFWANDKQVLTFERKDASTIAVTKPETTSLPTLPEPPRPALDAPTPLSPVIGPNGLPLVPSPVDATKPDNLLPAIP